MPRGSTRLARPGAGVPRDARDARGRRYLAALIVLAAAVVAVEACLVLPGHLLAAQIADAALVALLVSLGPRDGSQLSEWARAGLAALRALALVPLIRVVGLALPMRDWSDAVGLLLIALSVGAATLLMAPAVGVSRWRLAIPRLVVSHLEAAAAGAGLGFVAFLAGAPALWPTGADGATITVAVAAATCAAVVEELLFRGVLQLTFQRVAGTLGVLAASSIFAVTYLDAGSVALVLTYALAGFVFARSVLHSGVLGGAIVGHVLLAVGAGGAWPLVFDRVRPFELPEPLSTVVLTIAIAASAAAIPRFSSTKTEGSS
jgi:membrane protease YdiL (CAAX protease family)